MMMLCAVLRAVQSAIIFMVSVVRAHVAMWLIISR